MTCANVEHLGEIEAARRDRPRAARLERLLPDRRRVHRRRADGAASTRRSLAHDDRPYTYTNFAVTVDGHASIEGRSGAIGSDTDTAMLVGLRTVADAVMIGAGTMRAERYDRIFTEPERRARPRAARAARRSPRRCSSRAASTCPGTRRLFTDGGGRVLIFTASADDPPETATPVEVLRFDGGVDVREVMRQPPRRARRPQPALRGGAAAPRRAARGGPGRRAVRHPRPAARRRRGAEPRRGPRRERRSGSSSPGSCATGASSSPATGSASSRLGRTR